MIVMNDKSVGYLYSLEQKHRNHQSMGPKGNDNKADLSDIKILKSVLSKRGFELLIQSNATINVTHSEFPNHDGEGMLKDIRSEGDNRNLRVYKSADSFRRPDTPGGEIHSILYTDSGAKNFDVHGQRIKN